MSTEVKIPAVGESITSGIVSVWHKKSGDQVKTGDALFTLETDKVSTEITAEKDGVLQTRVAEGAEVKIIGGAGHLCYVEKPAEFNHIVREFLSRVGTDHNDEL